MRLRIDLAYDGAGFHGWARQPGLRTVQDEVESALATVFRQDRPDVTVAGRTDTGVHARGQVCHVDVDPEAARSAEPVARRLNGVLPAEVRVSDVREAAPGFDARFSALWRRYRYRIAGTSVDPLTRGYVVAWKRPLDVAAMNQAAAGLLGEHDFAAFCKRRPGATTIRTLLDLTWTREGTGVLVGEVRADAFCHSMVRALVGCLVAVGEGRREAEWPAEVLSGRERDPGVTVMPAHGLVLEEVGYPPDDELAAQAERARVVRRLG